MHSNLLKTQIELSLISKLLCWFMFSFAILLSVSCANMNMDSMPKEKIEKSALDYLQNEEYEKARDYLASGLRKAPVNCNLNFLNALTYHEQGIHTGDVKFFDLARVGYELVIHHCPDDPWAYYYNGLLALQVNQLSRAHELLKLAQQLCPTNAVIAFSYLISGYLTNDTEAIKTMITSNIHYPTDTITQRVLSQVRLDLPKLHELKNMELKNTQHSTHQDNNEAVRSTSITFDAVIILSKETKQSQRGFNLLDGLKLEYGSGDVAGLSATFTNTRGEPLARTIVNTITIPAISYNLNIFNDIDEQNVILSRPSIITVNGKTSSYFSGVDLLLGLSGLNSSSVERFPTGLKMELTPVRLQNGSFDVHIYLGHSQIINSETAQTSFKEIATLSNDYIDVNVNVVYGETILLSASAEQSHTKSHSGVPLLENIPIIKYFFSNDSESHLKTSVLFLLTPTTPITTRLDETFDSIPSSLRVYMKKHVQPIIDNAYILKQLKGHLVNKFPDLINVTEDSTS